MPCVDIISLKAMASPVLRLRHPLVQGGEVMDDILLAPRIGQLRGHPMGDAGALHDLAQHHDTGIAGQPLCAALDAKGLFEAGREGL